MKIILEIRNRFICYNETVEASDDYYDSLEKYGIDNKEDVVIPYLFAAQEYS